MATSYRSRTFETTTAHTAAWLLGQGARVIVRDAAVRRHTTSLLQRNARDGNDYERLMRQLLATGRGEAADERVLFAAAWKKKLIGITGTNGKTTTAVWAAHLIGDAIAVGPTSDKPMMSMLGSRARVALMESPPRGACSAVVDTDDYESNQAAAVAVARLVGVPMETIRRRCTTLPQIPHCQEVVHRDRTLTIVDDSHASTPARGAAAVHRFGGPNCILIAGGDGDHAYGAWADSIVARMNPNNIFFVSGSATSAMKAALGEWAHGIRTYDTLADAWHGAQRRAKLFLSAVILYSPAAVAIADEAKPW
ncbi:MAG TPA: hypothetical protein VMJ72_01160 [Candidatus Paceibacterota bacterium]|nr:hypothetical protein [Candidatus Paceibacterota bacterium]